MTQHLPNVRLGQINSIGLQYDGGHRILMLVFSATEKHNDWVSYTY